MRLTGKILWFSDRDGNGIIEDEQGNEYYFDTSVWRCSISNPQRNRLVSFELNQSIKDCNCATNVTDYLS